MGIKDLASKTAGISARPVEKTHDRGEPKTAPVRMYDVTTRMHAAEARAEELEAQLEEAKKTAAQQEIPLDQIVESHGRKRQLSEEEFSELVENLRNNPLVTPITVRPTGTGKYEIVSGHNRVAAFRELGREKIPAVIQDVDHVQADINAFYANLLQPSLPDYEKYLGFCMIKTRRPDLTHEQIADMAGVSRSQVTKLMAFASLPSDALRILDKNIRALSANAATDLAALVKQGKHDLVTKAVEQLVEGKINQAQAVELVSSGDATVAADTASALVSPGTATKAAKPKIEPTTIKQGKATYCSMRRVDKTIRLDFKNPEEAAALEQEILALIKARVKEGKDGD